MYKESPQLIVKPHYPWRKRILVIAAIIAVPVSWWLTYEYGRNQAGFDSWTAARERSALNDAISSLEDEKSALQQQVTTLKQTGEIDRDAYAEVNRSLKDLQDEILELKEEVAFYRGIVVSSEMTPGVRVQSFHITRSEQEGGYSYRLVLTQVLKDAQITTGIVKITVEGVQDGAPKQLSFLDLANKNMDSLKFRFRYFQRVDGDLVLPAGFVPTRVRVELNIERPSRATIERIYKWGDLLT